MYPNPTSVMMIGLLRLSDYNYHVLKIEENWQSTDVDAVHTCKYETCLRFGIVWRTYCSLLQGETQAQ